MEVWILSDGKAGHVNQMRGLASALGKLQPVNVTEIEAPAGAFVSWLTGRFAPGNNRPRPDLILAAGHRTHWAALAARRAHGGRVVLLMKPTLPVSWFDLCLIPEHDNPPAAPNIVVTRGVLNTIEPGTPAADRGLFLIGGPSTHHGWSDTETAGQVAAIVKKETGIRWKLTTSRRTPASFLSSLTGIDVDITPVEKTDPGWVRRELAAAGQVWVTEDSVSMVYESLTAGAAVGILPVPRNHTSRVTTGLDKMVAENWVTSFTAWSGGKALTPPPEKLNEAARCARLLIEKFLSQSTTSRT
jgi:mitochondrial fission protein ELM1